MNKQAAMDLINHSFNSIETAAKKVENNGLGFEANASVEGDVNTCLDLGELILKSEGWECEMAIYHDGERMTVVWDQNGPWGLDVTDELTKHEPTVSDVLKGIDEQSGAIAEPEKNGASFSDAVKAAFT